MDKPVLKVLSGGRPERMPIWIMRQAGRYLPEYRATRAKAGSFLDLCFTPELAVEVTLQPIRRFGFDASILFSDILVVPHALGQKVWFVEGEGPRLEPLESLNGIASAIDLERLAPVFETLRTLRRELPAQTTLLGFCGAPWTVAGYMAIGRGGAAHDGLRTLGYARPDFVDALLDRLVQSSIDYLCAQLDAGAEAVQVFESFAGSIPPGQFERWSLGPLTRIMSGVRARRPGARIILFARGAGANHIRIASETGCDAVGLDWHVDPMWAAAHVQPLKPTQGNLDPLALVAGGQALEKGADAVLEKLGSGPHIFNLGHGVTPETPIAHMERLIEIVRSHRIG
ncbi:uroporphyrinogen decarboxylase [Terrarubrum flagellatum]|uniref:uroporphyrinogen decarboxylase n=1 Tax=Terrirubrum flagellatum TaxID=2895980 RepID=UPI0031455425